MNGITTQFEKEQSPIKCESFWSPQLHVKLWFCIIHSTATAFLEATDSWPCYLDAEKINAVIFVDLKEAFDSTDHNIL